MTAPDSTPSSASSEPVALYRKTIDISAEEVFRRMDRAIADGVDRLAMFPGDHEPFNNVDSPPPTLLDEEIKQVANEILGDGIMFSGDHEVYNNVDSPPPIPRNRRALLRISPQFVIGLVRQMTSDLPEDTQYLGAHYCFEDDTFHVAVVSQSFYEVPEGCVAPYLEPVLTEASK